MVAPRLHPSKRSIRLAPELASCAVAPCQAPAGSHKQAGQIAFGLALRGYDFSVYKTKPATPRWQIPR